MGGDDTMGFLYEQPIMMSTPFATTIFCILMAQKVRCMKLMWPKALAKYEKQRFMIHSSIRVLLCIFGYFFIWFPLMRLIVCFCECFLQMGDHFRRFYFMPTASLIMMLIALHGYFQSKEQKTFNVSHNARVSKNVSVPPLREDSDWVERYITRHFYMSSPDE